MVKRQPKPRLHSSFEYRKYKWFGCVLEAKVKYRELSQAFDSLFLLRDKNKFYSDYLKKINTELEVLDDFFDWLQID